MSVTYVAGYENGDRYDDYSVGVNVMQCSACPDSAADAAYQGIKTGHDQLYANTSVPGTSVDWYKTNFTAASCDESTERDDANEWLDDNNFYSDELYLFVTNCPMARTWGLAWNGRCVGFVSNDSKYYSLDSEMKVMAHHEALHAYIADNCSKVQELANSNHQVDHKLGHIGGYKFSSEATPMCASYAHSSSTNYAGSGDCDNKEPINWGAWTTFLSICTESAVDHTLDHVKGRH